MEEEVDQLRALVMRLAAEVRALRGRGEVGPLDSISVAGDGSCSEGQEEEGEEEVEVEELHMSKGRVKRLSECKRCKRNFDAGAGEAGRCWFHPGRARTELRWPASPGSPTELQRRIPGKRGPGSPHVSHPRTRVWTCCGAQKGSPGCRAARGHVPAGYEEEDEEDDADDTAYG